MMTAIANVAIKGGAVRWCFDRSAHAGRRRFVAVGAQ